MTYVPENNCTAALSYAQFEPLYAIHWTQSLLSLATFLLCLLNLPIFPLLSRGRSISFHINVKILLAGALVFYAVHSLVNFGMHFGYVVLYHLPVSKNLCIYSITTWKCLLLRVPSYITVTGFTFAHLALCLERTIASFHIDTYEQFSARLGAFLLLPVFLIPISWNLWIFHNEDFGTEKAYCMSSSASSSPRLLGMSYALMALDLVAVLVDIGLCAVNRKQRRNKVVDYSLRKSFQLRENDLSIRLILPLSIGHSLMFTCFLAVYTVVKAIFADANGLTYAAVVESAHVIETLYTMVSVGLFLFLRRKLAARIDRVAAIEAQLKPSEQARLHHVQYQKYW